MDIIDSHCHLFLEEMAADAQGVLERARAAGVKQIVNVGLDLETSRLVLKSAKDSCSPAVRPAVGWHPHEAGKMTPADAESLTALAALPETVALGEIGLDYHYRPEDAPTQKTVFKRLLKAASEAKKPVIIHCREAWPDFFKIMEPERKNLTGVLLHCFSGSTAEARAGLDLDCHFSFAGVITFPKALELRQAFLALPRNRLMIETDAPYLAPQPFRGRRNEPAYLVHHLQTIAGLWQVSPEEAAAITGQNARRFFNLPADDV
ncbi:MAG: TatD family hydrolase [Deltaproteobacteria bacterium]|jgi:TatD DNase family protein|nr:TatD family hydrolase [Deltaproteobacteria bacterium]